jgi:hypothetical protein
VREGEERPAWARLQERKRKSESGPGPIRKREKNNCTHGSWVFLLLRERIDYSCATLLHKLHNLSGWQGLLVSKESLIYLAYVGTYIASRSGMLT